MSTSPLVVPMQLDALVLDGGSRDQLGFRRWVYSYDALGNFGSPEPFPGEGGESTEKPPHGVHLHWTLPAALRHGTHDPWSGEVDYPLVPNRWLVVRMSGKDRRTAAAWLIESDCPSAESTTRYLVGEEVLRAWETSGDEVRKAAAAELREIAADGKPVVETIGALHPLEGWHERATGGSFLTAVAPGNSSFSVYHPHCGDVFAFHDKLAGIDEDPGLSYLVAGWYSDPKADVLAGADHARLEALGWSAPAGETPTATLLHGVALSVPWSRAAPGPRPSPLDEMRENVRVAIADTAMDAFTALASKQLGDPALVDLLRAFQHGLLPQLEQVSGRDLMRTAVHQAGFGSRPAGLRWSIVSGEGVDAGEPEITDHEAAWLAQLNHDQAQLDAALLELDEHRWMLYAMWWKLNKGLASSDLDPPEGFDEERYREAVEKVLPQRLRASRDVVGTLRPRVPAPVVASAGTRQQAFDAGITAFASARGIGAGKRLRAAATARMWRSTDPVLVLAGIEPAPLPDPAATLRCRLATDLVRAFTAGGHRIDLDALGSAVPGIARAEGVPAAAAALVAEMFLLDPAGAPAIAAATGADAAAVAAAMRSHDPSAYQGPLPALGLAPWAAQPWAPLYVEWRAAYVHVPDETDGERNWSFDGHDYRFTGTKFGHFASDSEAHPREVSGMAVLAPEAQFNFRARMAAFLDAHPPGEPGADPGIEHLRASFGRLDEIGGWRLMSQGMTGLGDLLALRDTRAQAAPGGGTLAEDVAGVTHAVPLVSTDAPPPFHGVRQGQIALRELIVYDGFGQRLQVVGGTGATDPQNFEPVLDAPLVPDQPAIERNPKRLAQLAPRVNQHARLDFELAGAGPAAAALGGAAAPAGAGPVGGWVVYDHVGGGLLLYDAEGASLGELGLLVDRTGRRTARWQPPPHRAITEADVAAAAPEIAAMISSPAIASPAAFGALLGAIDRALWTIDPPGDRADQSLSLLIGRPLALVRARVSLRLDGAPVANLAPWEVTTEPARPELADRPFGVRLGADAIRGDGLVGYFVGGDRTVFNSVAPPDPEIDQRYVRQIGPVGAARGGNFLEVRPNDQGVEVTLLLDPRGSVHAVTGILPAKTLELPARYVDGPLSALDVGFRVGSLLTHVEPAPGGEGDAAARNPDAIALNVAPQQGGSWSWWEPAVLGGERRWRSYDLVPATQDARLKDAPNTLRDGYLQLEIDLGAARRRGTDR